MWGGGLLHASAHTHALSLENLHFGERRPPFGHISSFMFCIQASSTTLFSCSRRELDLTEVLASKSSKMSKILGHISSLNLDPKFTIHAQPKRARRDLGLKLRTRARRHDQHT